MYKGLYKHEDGRCLYWYKTWKNSTKNSGMTMAIWEHTHINNVWPWENCEDEDGDSGTLVGAECLAQW